MIKYRTIHFLSYYVYYILYFIHIYTFIGIRTANEKLSLGKSSFSRDNNSTLFRHPLFINRVYVRPGAFYYPEVAREIVWYVQEGNTTSGGGSPLILLGVKRS